MAKQDIIVTFYFTLLTRVTQRNHVLLLLDFREQLKPSYVLDLFFKHSKKHRPLNAVFLGLPVE
jgi:hypothetical protein